MAATAITPAQAELINSLTQDEVPIKLRCAICSKLAVNAYKLPCCEQAICETCQSTLPPSCPVCEHSPLSASDCNPNKALRTTIRVFLKTEEKKRGIGQPKEKDTTPVTPVEPKDVTPSVVPEKASKPVKINDVVDTAESQGEHGIAVLSEEPKEGPVADEEPGHQASADVQDAPTQEHGSDDAGDINNMQLVEHEGGDVAPKDDADQASESKDNDEADTDGQQAGDYSNGFGVDAANGGFQNMNFGNGDFNQMQMMMAMQNGMGANSFGGFPMMAGMSGMMDPMMMQNMYMNGGFGSQGMGMNGMMGMGGYNGGAGSGSDNNWNDQQSWNGGQDNFNHQNASGMANGDYGNFNSGFQTGYNQGNFGHHNQFNDYRGNRYGYGRGRGRGRGGYGYGRGGYGYGMNGGYGAQNYMSQQYSGDMADQAPNDLQSSGNAPGEQKQADNVDEFGRTIRPDEDTAGDPEQADTNEAGDKGAKQEGTEEAGGPEKSAGDGGLAEGATKPIPALGETSSASNGDAVSAPGPSVIPTGPMAAGYQNYNRGGSFGGMPPPAPAADVPLNAPKGPKAMRQGLPNTSLLNLRARGYHIPGETIQSPKTGAPAVASPADRPRSSRSSSPDALKRKDSEQYHKSSREHDKERDRSRERERRDRDRDRDASRSPSRSRSRDRRDSRKRRRHRSQSASDVERDDDYHRRRHRRKHSTYGEDDVSATRSRDDKHEERSRSASPDDSRRSSHRSRKDRDSEKRRDRDKDRDRDRDRDSDYERRRKSSHRSRRDRDYDRDYDRDRGKDRARDRDRDRDRDREHRHRSRRSSAEPPTPVDSQEKDFNPPAGPRSGSVSHSVKGIEIRGANSKARDSADPSRRSSQSSQRATPTAPAAASDPHAAEREARNRERLLRETQRLAGLAGFKRKSDDGEDAKRSRRKGRRGDVVTADDEEARMRRLEAERERSRWS